MSQRGRAAQVARHIQRIVDNFHERLVAEQAENEDAGHRREETGGPVVCEGHGEATGGGGEVEGQVEVEVHVCSSTRRSARLREIDRRAVRPRAADIARPDAPVPRRRWSGHVRGVSDALLETTADEITARIRTAVTAAAGEPVAVHGGEEAYGFRNIGVELPKARRSVNDTRRLCSRLAAALEGIRVALSAHALASSPAARFRRTRGRLVDHV